MKTKHRIASRAKRDLHTTAGGVADIDAVLKAVALVSSADRDEVMSPIREARRKLQFGGFTKDDWSNLVDGMNLSEAMMRPGIRIARDHADTVATAQAALCTLRLRRKERGTWVVTGQELKEIDDALWILDKVQMANVSNKELTTAHQIIRNVIDGALTGGPGTTILHADDIDDTPKGER